MNGLTGTLGDIFWNLAPSIVYSSGSELGATIYVANPTEESKEYALMARLSSDDTVISEEAVKIRLHRARAYVRNQLQGYFEEK